MPGFIFNLKKQIGSKHLFKLLGGNIKIEKPKEEKISPQEVLKPMEIDNDVQSFKRPLHGNNQDEPFTKKAKLGKRNNISLRL